MSFYKLVTTNLKKCLKESKGYVGWFTFCSFIYFCGSMFLNHPAVKEEFSHTSWEVSQVVNSVTHLSFTILLLFSLVVLYFLGITNLRKRRGEFLLYRGLGMTQKQFFQLLLLENMLIGVFSSAGAIIIGCLFSKVLFSFTERFFTLTDLSFYFPGTAIFTTFYLYLLVGLILTVIFFVTCKKEFLENLNDKYIEKVRPRSRGGLIAGVLCLITGYASYLLLLTQLFSMVGIMIFSVIFPIILILVGWYLVFQHGSRWLYHRENKKPFFDNENDSNGFLKVFFYRCSKNSFKLYLLSAVGALVLIIMGINQVLSGVLYPERNELSVAFSYHVETSKVSKSDKLKQQEDVEFIQSNIENAGFDVFQLSIDNTLSISFIYDNPESNYLENVFIPLPISQYNDWLAFHNKQKLSFSNDYQVYQLGSKLPKYSLSNRKGLKQSQGTLFFYNGGEEVELEGVEKIILADSFNFGNEEATVLVVSDELYSKIMPIAATQTARAENQYILIDFKEWYNQSELSKAIVHSFWQKQEENALFEAEKVDNYSNNSDYLLTQLTSAYQFKLEQSRLKHFFLLLNVCLAILFILAEIFFYYANFNYYIKEDLRLLTSSFDKGTPPAASTKKYVNSVIILQLLFIFIPGSINLLLVNWGFYQLKLFQGAISLVALLIGSVLSQIFIFLVLKKWYSSVITKQAST